MKCLTCRNERHNTTAKYCMKCGTKLYNPSFCSECGQKITYGDQIYCDKCGVKLK